MKNKIIEDQLKKVEVADLSHKSDNVYFIPRRVDIKLEEDHCYLIHLKDSAFRNDIITTNWNAGSIPKGNYFKADISKKMPNMIKILGVVYDPETHSDLNSFWSGWLSINDIEIIERL